MSGRNAHLPYLNVVRQAQRKTIADVGELESSAFGQCHRLPLCIIRHYNSHRACVFEPAGTTLNVRHFHTHKLNMHNSIRRPNNMVADDDDGIIANRYARITRCAPRTQTGMVVLRNIMLLQ